MPAIEVTETGTKTMPTPSPRMVRPGRTSVAKCALLVAVDSHSDEPTVTNSPMVAMTRGERWPSMCRAKAFRQ